MTKPQGPRPQIAHQEPIEKFLGSDIVGQGPFAVLGLHPDDAIDENILKALEARLDRISDHPESGTPQADEVRLAIHAAAAQLLDPAIRKHLRSRSSGNTNAKQSNAVSPTARLALEHDAILTLAMFGGWNKRSLRRLASLAHARGMSSAQLADALGNLAIRRTGTGRVRQAAIKQTQTRPQPGGHTQTLSAGSHHETSGQEMDPASHHLGNVMLIGGIITIGLIVLVWLALVIINEPILGGVAADRAQSSGQTVEDSDLGIGVESLPRASDSGRQTKTSTGRRTSILPAFERVKAELEIAIEGLVIDVRESQDRFDEAIDDLSVSWTMLGDDELIAVHSAILEFLYRSGSDTLGLEPVRAIAVGAFLLEDESLVMAVDDIPRVVWSVGMLTRLSRERDLSASAGGLIESSLGAALGGGRPRIDPTFQSGAFAAIGQLASRLAPVQDASSEFEDISKIWGRWAQVVDHVCRDDPQQRAHLLLVGIESLLLGEVEPVQSQELSSAVALLVTKLTWRDDEGSRRWLLRWFNHRGISNADLNVVTSTLATKSAARGVDITMVLSAAASERARTDMRSAYATAWNMEGETLRQEVEAVWIREARQSVEESFNARSPVEHLAAAATSSRLSQAARWLWKGESSEATAILEKGNDDIKSLLDSADNAQRATVLAVHSGDGQWAAEYLAAGHMIPVRLELLAKKSRDHSMDPVDAEVVAGEAFYGSPRDVQSRAKQLVLGNSENPAMINALLELVPRVPRTQANSRLIEQVCLVTLCDVRRDQWPKQARQALVQFLIEKLAAEGSLGVIDRLASIFADSYALRSRAQPIGPDASYTPVHVAPEDSVLAIWNDRNQIAERLIPSHSSTLTLDQIRRRRMARVSNISGAAQLFAAEQTSLVELTAYIIAAEDPEHAEAAALIVADMASQRRKAKTIFEQINVTERAFLRLWLIRHGEAFS